MPVHDLLRELVETRGAGVVTDADQFRGALDDFLEEHEASRGEINLLVDAVRLGAVTRLVAMLDHGAEPSAALDEVAIGLARDRGADSASGARWALGVIGFALGKVPADLRGSDRPSSIPAPPQRPITATPPPPVPDVSTEPTEPPSHPSFPRPESAPLPAPPAPLAPERTPAPPTNVAGAPPDRPGTMAIPELSTEQVPDDPPPPAPPPAQPPPFLLSASPPAQPARKGRGKLVAIVTALLLVVAAGVIGAVLLTGGADDDPDEASDDAPGSGDTASPDDDTGSSSSSPPEGPGVGDSLPVTSVVLPVTVDGDTSLYVVDTADGTASQLTQGTDDRLPTISPDRTTVIFLRPEARGTGLRAPHVLDLTTGEERPLFDDSSPCQHTSRPAWSPAGDQLVVTCVNDDGDYTGTHIVGLDGQEQQELVPDGIPDGGFTWASDSTLIYGRSDGSGSPTTLWTYSLGDGVSTQVSFGPGWDSHPDWSDENGVAIFQRSEEDGPDVRGDLWTISPNEGEAKLEIGQPVAHGALSGDGSLLLFVVDTDDGERLASAPFGDPSDVTVYDQVPGEPGAPAGGSL